ncbi:unnamed protein product [Moneuplotes crassus]|uniref:Uncharacterized protein n=1 Tax=Euplotes crassus TaxID=5936 RepID=A0AAD1U9S2_EUPCR|nr:unnamed protein product [Moneuplotes crassus]
MNITAATRLALSKNLTVKNKLVGASKISFTRLFSTNMSKSGISLDKVLTNPCVLKSTETVLKTDVVLRALPYKVTSPQHSEPPILINNGKEMTPREIFEEDLQSFTPQFVCVQIDPMKYSKANQQIGKVYIKQQQNKDVKDDKKLEEKNNKFIDKKLDGMLHPDHGDSSLINMGIAEGYFDIKYPKFAGKFRLEKIFDEDLKQIIPKVHKGTADEKELDIFNQRLKSVKPLLDFAINEFHVFPPKGKDVFTPGPCIYHGMEEIYKQCFFNLIDICLVEYPEPLSRLFLHKIADLDYYKAKEIYEGVITCGEELSQRSQMLGFGPLVSKAFQKRIIHEIFPNICVNPRDEYIASHIYQLSDRGYKTMVYLGEANFEGVKKLLEDPPKHIKIPNTLANADMSLFEEDIAPKDQYGNIEDDPIKIEENRTKIPENWKDQIEAHAMLEAAFGTMAWGEPYLKNQFPYLKVYREDIHDDMYMKFQQYFKEKYVEHRKPIDKIFK